MKFIGIAIGLIAMFIVVLFFSLIFIKIGWALFMVPVFNLPNLTWMQALGFSFLASSFKTYNTSSKKD